MVALKQKLRWVCRGETRVGGAVNHTRASPAVLHHPGRGHSRVICLQLDRFPDNDWPLYPKGFIGSNLTGSRAAK